MKRRFNVRFLLIVIGIVVLTGGSAHLVHELQKPRIADALHWQSQRYHDQGDLLRAAGYLGRYLEFCRDDLDAQEQLADLQETLGTKTGNPKRRVQALLLYDQVLRGEPSRDQVRRRLVRLAMDLDRSADAIVHLEILKEHCPQDGELYLLEGRCLEVTRRNDEARRAYETAIKLAPQLTDSYVRLATLLRRQWDKPAEADVLLEKMIEANSQSYAAYLARARYRNDFGMLAGSAADVESAYQLAPEEAEVLLQAATLAQSRRQHALKAGETERADRELAAARQYLQDGCKRHPTNVRMHQALAWLELGVGQPKLALACLQQGLHAVTKREEKNDLRWTMAEALLQLDRVDQAQQTIDHLQQGGYPRIAVDYLKARLLVQKRHWDEALRAFQKVRALAATWPEITQQVDLYLGRCYEQLDEPDRQLEAYRRALARDRSSAVAQYGMAGALAGLGRIDEALAEYHKLSKLPNAPPGTAIAIARLTIVKNLRLPPAQRDWQAVAQALDRADAPSAVEVWILRAEALVAQEQLDQARSLLEEKRQAHPDEVVLWTALASVIDRQEKPEESLAVLDEAEKKLGDRIELRLARARHWGQHAGAGAGAALAKLQAGLEQLKPEEQTRLLRGLADACHRAGDLKEARRLGAQLAQRDPSDMRIRGTLFELALQAGDQAEAERWQQEMNGVDQGRGTLAQVRLLIWRAREGETDLLPDARQKLDDILVKRPTWLPAVLCRAELEDVQGDSEQALTWYKRAFDELGERRPYSVARLLSLQRVCNRPKDAYQTVRKLHQENALPAEALKLAAEVCLLAKDNELALELARKGASADASSAADLLWRGQLYWAVDKKEEAEKDLRRAIQLDPKAPEPWLALIRCLAQGGQAERAKEAVAEACKALPKASLALAGCHELVRDFGQARKSYQAALKAQPDNVPTVRAVADFYLRSGTAAEAEPLLRRLLEPKLKASESDLAWTRRGLAITLAAGGAFQRFNEALALLDQNLQADPTSVEDLRARASVLATQKGRTVGNESARKQAIRILEELIQRKQASPSDQFLLARLYRAEGDWSKTRGVMVQLLGSSDKNPQFLAFYVRSLLRQGQNQEAEVWLDALKKADPNSSRTIELQVRLWEAQDKTTELIQLLTANANRADDKTADPSQRLRFAATLLDELSQTAARRKKPEHAEQLAMAAEQMYRKYLEQKPDELTGFVVFLGRQGQLQEAFKLCEPIAQKSPQQAAVLGLSAVRARSDGGALPPDARPFCKQVDGWLRDAIQNEPRKLEHLLHLADLRDLEGQYAEAEKLYRQVLAKDERNVVALNNLAWLLAQRNGNGGETLQLINRAIDLAGPMGELLDTRAVIRLAMQQSDRAVLDDLLEAVRESPTPSRYFHLARAQQLAKNRSAAAKALNQEHKNARVEVSDLHPLERPAYEKLLGELQR